KKDYSMTKVFSICIILCGFVIACAQKNNRMPTINQNPQSVSAGSNSDTAIFANGCFWCTEAIFQQLEGVTAVASGYTGGDTEHPDYAEVSTGTTGHAEALQIIYDPAVISYDELLEVFWKTHDPTTLNRQ